MRHSFIWLVLLLFNAITACAFADTVSYRLTGSISEILIDSVAQASLGPLALDTPFSVDFTIDKSAANISPPGDNQAVYPQPPTLFNYFVSVGGLTLQSSDALPGSASVQISDGPPLTTPDSIYVFAGSTILSNIGQRTNSQTPK